MRILVGCVVLLGLVVAGERAEAKGAAKPPASLIASVALGSDATLDTLKPFVDAIKPGVSPMLTGGMVRSQLASIVGASSLDGLDGSAGLYVLLVDDGSTVAQVVVGKVKDEKALLDGAGTARVSTQRGWAVIGAKPIVDQVAGFAFASIAPQPTPTVPTATVYVPNALARYRAQIGAARTSMYTAMTASGGADLASMTTGYLDGLFSMLEDSDRLVVTLDATKDLGAFDLAFVPRARSRLAAFVAAQRPSDYALLARLPAAGAPVIAAGHLESGPYREGMLDVMGQIYGRGGAKDIMAAISAVMKASTGDFAMTMSMGTGKPMAMAQLFGVADRARADKAIDAVLGSFKNGRTFESMNISTTIKTLPATTDHDGVTVKGYDVTYDLSKAPAASRASLQASFPNGTTTARVATFERVGLLTMGTDTDAAIDAARGKGPQLSPTGTLADFLASSRAHKDSVLFAMDLNMVGKLPGGARMVMFSLGFADGSSHMRFTMPTSVIRSFAGQP